MVTYFSIKVAQIYFENFWAILKDISFKLNSAVETFWQLLVDIGLHFILTSGHTVMSRAKNVLASDNATRLFDNILLYVLNILSNLEFERLVSGHRPAM